MAKDESYPVIMLIPAALEAVAVSTLAIEVQQKQREPARAVLGALVEVMPAIIHRLRTADAAQMRIQQPHHHIHFSLGLIHPVRETHQLHALGAVQNALALGLIQRPLHSQLIDNQQPPFHLMIYAAPRALRCDDHFAAWLVGITRFQFALAL